VVALCSGLVPKMGTSGTWDCTAFARSRLAAPNLAGSPGGSPVIQLMKKLLSLLFLVVFAAAFPFRANAQQSTPATPKPSTPAAGKKSTPSGSKSSASTPAPSGLAMPVPAKPTKVVTPIPAKPSASEPENAPPKSRVTNWEVYPAEQMPPGKSLTEPEAAKLASGDYSEKVLYLVGTFYVAVAEKSRAILWPNQTLGPVHVVVAYPLSIPAPEEGAKIVRDPPRGYRITRIKHTAGDETTIYVRNITVP